MYINWKASSSKLVLFSQMYI